MKDTERARKEYIERYLGKPVAGNAKTARGRYIFRMTHGDADEGEERDRGEAKHGGNTRLPYGLCAEFGIDTEGFSPEDCWETLADKGVSRKVAYVELKKNGTVRPYADKVKAKYEKEDRGESTKNNIQAESNKVTVGKHFTFTRTTPMCKAKTLTEAVEFQRTQLGINKDKNITYFRESTDIRAVNTLTNCIADAFDYAPKLKGKLNMCGTLGYKRGDNTAVRKQFRAEMFPIYMKYLNRVYPNYPMYDRVKSAEDSCIIENRGNTYAIHLSWENHLTNMTEEEMRLWKRTADKYTGVYLSGNNFNNYDEIVSTMAHDEETSWSPQGCGTLKALFDHEICHAIDETYDISNNSKVREFFRTKVSREKVNDGLSRYAATRPTKAEYECETIAEAWSEYINNPKPRPIALELGNIIKEVIENDKG